MSEKTTAKAIKADLAQKQALEPVPRDPSTVPPARSLVAKLAEVMAAVGRIPKRGRNDFHGYDYATEADIVELIRGELASRQIMLIPSVTKHDRLETGRQTKTGGFYILTTVSIAFTFHDGVTGESLTQEWMGCGWDAEDKGLYKAMTGAEKYFLMKTFLLPTGDDPETEPKELRQKAKVGAEEGSRASFGIPAPAQKAPQASQDAPRAPQVRGVGLTPVAPPPIPSNVDPVTGEEYPPCPPGAVYVLKYAFDRGMHTALVSDMVEPEKAREVSTKFDQGLTLKAACETKRPVVVAMNAKGYLTKCDWYVAPKGPIAKKLATALREDEPPVSAYDDESTPF